MKKLLALVLALCLLCATAAAAAEEFHVGILQLVQHDALDAATKGFMDKLTELLAADGDTVVFDYQNAQGDSATCSVIATGFVNNGYDLIMANATPALQACVSATGDIPLVGTSVTDYATALADPEMDITVGTGINVTGASDGVDGMLYAKMVMELVPGAKAVNVVYCSAEANSVVQYEAFKAAMAEIAPDVAVNNYTFADSNDIQAVVTGAAEGVDAIYIPTDNTAASNMTIVSNILQPAGIPVICGEENMMAAGGLATVSISYTEVGTLAGEQAYKILKGQSEVGATPIAYCSQPVKEYNPEYAEAIGFTVPEDYVAYAPAE